MSISQPKEQKSFFTASKEHTLEKLKNQVFEKLKSKRKSMLNERRKQNVLRESKKHSQINFEISNDKEFLDQMVLNEILKMQICFEQNPDLELEMLKKELADFCDK